MVQSALVGEPPLTTDDYWIVKGSFLAAGLTSADPNKGFENVKPGLGIQC